MQYLLAVTIGPIQPNIQMARSTRDLINTSKLTSDVIKNIGERIEGAAKDNVVIYPKIEKDVDTTNYLLCRVEEVDQLLRRIEESSKLWSNLIEAHYFKFWVAEPLDARPYHEVYTVLMKRLKSIKNTCLYSVSVPEEKSLGDGVKCEVCGVRVAEGNLKICGVCYQKRERPTSFEIPSTYDVAIKVWHAKHEADLKKVDEKLNRFSCKSKYYNLDLVKRLARAETYSEYEALEVISDFEEKTDKHNLDKIKLYFKDLKETLDELYKGPVPKPVYKYAFIQADIDNLGRFMRGRYLLDKEDLESAQRKLSECLGAFSCALKNEAPKHVTCIYAGGDDILLLVPLEAIMTTIDFLSNQFKAHVQVPVSKANLFTDEITISTAVTVSACKDDMATALVENRKALEETKLFFGHKGTVGLNYIVNNGKVVNAYFNPVCFEIYKTIIDQVNKVKQRISFNYIRSFDHAFQFAEYLSDFDREDWIQMQKIEFGRRLNRSIQGECSEIDQFITQQMEFFERMLRSKKSFTLAYRNTMQALYILEKLSTFDMKSLEVNTCNT